MSNACREDVALCEYGLWILRSTTCETCTNAFSGPAYLLSFKSVIVAFATSNQAENQSRCFEAKHLCIMGSICLICPSISVTFRSRTFCIIISLRQ